MCLPHLERLAIHRLPPHGAENGLFLSKGSEMTHDLLREKNGDGLCTRHAAQPPRAGVLRQILRPGPIPSPGRAPPTPGSASALEVLIDLMRAWL